MRTLFLALALACAALAPTGCNTAPSARVQEVKTLKAVGLAVDGTMQLAAQLYHDGKIDAALWQKIAVAHDTQFQPAYRFAVAAVQANLDSVASPDLVALAAQLAALVAPYVSKS